MAVSHWGAVIEDYLEPIGLTFADFRDEMTGGWFFGYAEALRRAGVQPAFVCFTREVRRPERFVHRPTGAPLLALPSPRVYRALRGATVGRRGAEPLEGARRTLVKSPVASLTGYLATSPRQLAAGLRSLGAAALICQEYASPRFDLAVPAGRLAGVRVFASYQGSRNVGLAPERLARRLAVRCAAGLIIGSSEEAARVRRTYHVPEARIARIFNPIDLDMWNPADRASARAELGLPDDARVAVWHGRVNVTQKGLDVLAEAWQQVCAARPDSDLRLLLVGGGDDARQLRELIADRGLRGVHRRDGYLLDRGAMRRHLSAGDVYAFPSREEGFAVAPLEAMACGLPVVGAAASGVADMLEGGEEAGGIVVPRDDAAALAAELGRLLDDPVRSQELGRLARRRIEEHFSLEAVGAQLRAFVLG